MGGGSPGKKPVASPFIASPLLERPMAPWLDMRAGRTPGVISNLSKLSSRPSVTAASIEAGCGPVALPASAPPQHVLRASSTMEAIDWRSAMAWIGKEKMVTKERPIRAALMMGEAGYEERMLERTREPTWWVRQPQGGATVLCSVFRARREDNGWDDRECSGRQRKTGECVSLSSAGWET